MPMSAARRGVFWVILVAFSLASSLSMAEIAARLTGKFELQRGFEPHPELGWWPEGRSATVPVRPGASRVVFLGDSFTQPGRFIDAFEQRLPAACGPVDVLNLGVSGYGTTQELRSFQLYGRTFDPDLVVLAIFVWNDLADNLNDIFYSPLIQINRPHLAPRGDGWVMVNDSEKTVLPTWLLERSAFARALLFVNLKLVRGFYQYGEFDGWSLFYAPGSNPRAEAGYAVTRELLRQTAEAVAAAGARLLIVGFDNAFTVESAVDGSQRSRSNAERYRQLDLERPMTWLARTTGELGVPFLNLTERFREVKQSDPLTHLYRPTLSGHFTARGSVVAGTAIAERVVEDRLLPCGTTRAGN